MGFIKEVGVYYLLLLLMIAINQRRRWFSLEYTIHGFSQENAIKLGLDDRDLLILRWFVRFKDNGKMASKIIDGDKYYWIKYEGIIEDLPITNIKSNDSSMITLTI